MMLSCTTGENKPQLLDEISTLASSVMGKQLYTLVYPCEQHNSRLSWLYKHASMTGEQDFKYFGESISINVLLDEVTY